MTGFFSPYISPLIQAGAVTFAMVSMFPKSEPVVDVRTFRHGQTIELEVSKPPLAALADIYFEYDPAQKAPSLPVVTAQARPVKLEPVILDVSDVLADESSRIVAHESKVTLEPTPESIGFSRRGAVPSPHQAEAQTLTHFLTTRASGSEKHLPKETGKTLGGMYGRKERAPKASQPEPAPIEVFETAQGFRDYAREITGKIEFKPGLAMTSSTDQLVVYRQVKGERLDQGHVFYDHGEFAIYVAALRGDLVGELRDVKGHILGRGAINLDKVYTDRRQVSNLSLFIEPSRSGFGGHVYDWAASFKSGELSAVKDARVDYLGFSDFVRTMPDGSFLDVDVVTGSQTLVQISSEGYLPTIGYVQEGEVQDLPMLKEEYFERLFPVASLAREKTSKNVGYVIGRVLEEGSPRAGAKVSLIDGLKIKPVYLTEDGRPARRQDQTDSSGFFVLPDIPPGLSAIKVSSGPTQAESKVLPVGLGAVTYLEVDMSSDIDVEVTYRSFPGDALTPMVTRTLASEDITEPLQDVMGRLSVSAGADPLFIVADGGETFEPMTYTALRESSSLELPVLKTAWVESLYSKLGQIKMNDSGQVLGWLGAGSSFVVDLDQLEGESIAKVVYLDPRGEVLIGATEGVVGGSYILLNVTEGLRRVRVYYSTGEYSSCLAYLEAGTTAACAY